MLLGRLAGQMVSLVLVLLVLQRYGSPALAGVTTFLAIMPGLLVSPIAGTLLDRFGRRRLILIDYSVACCALCLLAGLSIADLLPVPLFLAIVFAQSLTFPLSSVGMRTLFPLVVPRPLWERANAMDSNGYAVSTIFGPAIAGAVVAALHGEGGLLVAAAVFAVAVVVTLGVPDPEPEGRDHGHVLRAAWDGVVHVALHPTLRGLAVAVSIGNLANGIVFITIPVVVLQRLGGTTTLVGQLFALSGVVAFVSVLLVGRIQTEGRERSLMIAAASLGAVAVALLLARIEVATLVVAMLLRGMGEGLYDVPMFTLRQRRTDPAWLGRAFAVSMSANFVGYPIGSAIGGTLAAAGPETALAGGLASMVVSIVSLYALIPRA
ncbi:MAG: MFS transporter [Chloroflexota bacterium]|nr:MFS transporter [Chloroflexota bacterium]MDE3194306.1 MFS transporter [Chloroflexota bacterium]